MPDYATVAYSASNGAQRWVRRYSGPGHDNAAYSMAISRTRGTVFVTGFSTGTTSSADSYTTIAYTG